MLPYLIFCLCFHVVLFPYKSSLLITGTSDHASDNEGRLTMAQYSGYVEIISADGNTVLDFI